MSNYISARFLFITPTLSYTDYGKGVSLTSLLVIHLTSNTASSDHSADRQMFALLIGIDHYESSGIPRLSGAVADTEDVLQFLYTLSVPLENIQVLRDCSASRQSIIDSFRNLRDNPRIKPGDAIVIYFAGHGDEILAPPGWEVGETSGMIQVLIPHDYCQTSGKEIVPAIPDRTVGALLEDIAEKKGNNIVRTMNSWN